jgi:putative cell wall-binding protein
MVRIAIVGAVAVVASMTSFSAAAAPAAQRIAGADRYDTAAQIAARFGAARYVVLANGSTEKQGFDALAANYLAGVVGAPILLTAATSLPTSTVTALEATANKATGLQVLVMGKADSVSDAVVKQVNTIVQKALGDTLNHVTRVAGGSRYDTAVQAATVGGDNVTGALVERYSIGGGSTVGRTAFLASGTSNADALAAGPISNALRIPVYLTGPTSLPDSAATALASQGVTNLIVLGGSDRVPDSVVAQAKSAGVVAVHRVSGSNRFATAAALYTFARSTLTGVDGAHYGKAGAPPVYLANGYAGFPDALAVGPLAAKSGAVLLTTSQARLEPAAQQFLAANGAASVTALGSAATVSDAALNAAVVAVG